MYPNFGLRTCNSAYGTPEIEDKTFPIIALIEAKI